MASPKDLLDERLARGEITHDEYDRIQSKLSSQPTTATTPHSTQAAQPSSFKRDGWWGFVIFGIGANIFTFKMLAAGTQQGFAGHPNSLGMLLIALFSLVAVFGFAKLAFGK